MEQPIPLEEFKGRMNEVVLGTGDRALKIGGDASYPFHYFEGTLSHPPGIALEIPEWGQSEDWASGVREPFADVLTSPVAWARKGVETYGAKALFVRLKSTDPAKENKSPEEAASLVREFADAVDVPLIVYGSGRKEKDGAVLAKVAEACTGRNLFLGPAVAENLDQIGSAALNHGHGVIIQTPLEISPAKELNIRLTKTFPADRVLFDPTSLALGYGMEFTYSLIEQVRQGALFVNDVNLQMPFFANIGQECWSAQEAKANEEQGIVWESITGMTLLLAGAGLLVVRHPEVYHVMKEIVEGGAEYVNE